MKDQEPGDKDYALFLQIDGAHGNQYTYDLSFLDIDAIKSDDKRLDFKNLPVTKNKDIENFNGASLELSKIQTHLLNNGQSKYS